MKRMVSGWMDGWVEWMDKCGDGYMSWTSNKSKRVSKQVTEQYSELASKWMEGARNRYAPRFKL